MFHDKFCTVDALVSQNDSYSNQFLQFFDAFLKKIRVNLSPDLHYV